jgi:predicted nucleotidyltransferase
MPEKFVATDWKMHQEYLKAFVDKADSDGRILAVWLEGSFAKGTADRYSDIDIHLLVAEEDNQAFQQGLESWLSDIQSLVLFRETFPGQMITCITTAGLRLDVWLHPADTISLEHTKVHVLFAAEGCIQFKETCRDKEPKDVSTALKQQFNEFWRVLAILPTVLGREELIAGFMGTTFAVMSLTEALIIGNGNQRDRGVKNINAFVPQALRKKIETALTMQSINRESIAKAHLRLAAIMQQYGPDIAKQHGVIYPLALEKAVLNYVSRELQILGLSNCLNELRRL